MTPAPPPASRTSIAATLVLPALVLAVGLSAAAFGALKLGDLSATRDRERFERLATEQVEDIQERMDTYLALLRGTVGLYAASTEVTRAEFNAYFDHLHVAALYPGIQGIGFARRFPVSERDALLRDLRKQGFADIRFRPEPPGDTVTAIVALEPLDPRNAGAIGYDMFSEPTRRTAMERARDTGEAAMTTRTELVQEAGRIRQPGFLIYLPVYVGGTLPETSDERRARLRGWVYAPFRAGDLFPHVTARTTFGRRPELAYRVFDGGEAGASDLLYASSAVSVVPPGAPSVTRHLAVAGHPWTLVASATPAFVHDPNGALWPPVLLGGIAATLVLAWAALAQARARRRSEQARAALLEETERLELLNATGSALVAERDLGRLVQTIVETATTLTGATCGAFFEHVPDGGDRTAAEAWHLYGFAGPRPEVLACLHPDLGSERVFRSDDVTRGSDSGPEATGAAREVPMRSCLAVPVVSRSGEGLGVLMFGHPRSAVFGPREERLAVGLSAQATVALDNARLFASVNEARDRAELLLREVNHRVANSLALVAALADMQRRAVSDLPAKAALDEMRARVSAIAGIHRRLYTSDDVEAVELDAYLSSLVEELQAAMCASGRDHPIRLRAEPVRLATDKAVSVGVVVTELVTNAYKYAYPSGSSGEIRVEVRRPSPGSLELAVADDGVGWTGEGEIRGTGLGSRIVKAMAANLRSVPVYGATGRGTRIVLSFLV